MGQKGCDERKERRGRNDLPLVRGELRVSARAWGKMVQVQVRRVYQGAMVQEAFGIAEDCRGTCSSRQGSPSCIARIFHESVKSTSAHKATLN